MTKNGVGSNCFCKVRSKYNSVEEELRRICPICWVVEHVQTSECQKALITSTDENSNFDLNEQKIKQMFQTLAMSPRKTLTIEENKPDKVFGISRPEIGFYKSQMLEIRRIGDGHHGFLPVPSQMSEEEILEKILC